MVSTSSRLAVVTAAILVFAVTSGLVPASAGSEDVRKRAVVRSESVWKQLRDHPSEEQIRYADIDRLVMDNRAGMVMVMSAKMDAVPSAEPGEPGYHSLYLLDFTTTSRRGRAPIEGSLHASTYSGSVGGAAGGEPCPVTVTVEPSTSWVIFTMRKSCFPGRHRLMTRYRLEVRSYNHVMREDGVVDDTTDVAQDWTYRGDAAPIRLR